MADTPITTAEAKAWCRVEVADDDTLIGGLITAASDYLLNTYGIVCATSSHVLSFDAFADRLPLYRSPVVSVTTVSYTSDAGVETTLASDQYRLRKHHGVSVLQPAYGVTWPATECIDGAVTVTVSAGYANNAAVPEAIRTAALLLVAHWYDNRAAVVVGSTTNELALAVDDLARPYRTVVLG